MEETNTDLLFTAIVETKNLDDLNKLSDKLKKSVAHEEIPDKKDAMILSLAIQQKYGFLLFSQVLQELEQLLGFVQPEGNIQKKFEKEIEELQEKNVIMLKKYRK